MIIIVVLSHLFSAQSCSPINAHMIHSRNGLSRESNLIELRVAYKIDFKHPPVFVFDLDPPLVVHEDYEVDLLKSENSLPHYRTLNSSFVGLTLLPNKVWVKDLNRTNELVLNHLHVCPDDKTEPSKSDSQPLNQVIAKFHHFDAVCPQLPLLPGASPELTSAISAALKSCANVRIMKSGHLNAHKVSSFHFLLPNTKLVLIDGHEGEMSDVTKAVDAFMARHSVLKLVWEPYTDSEPRWFVLMPYPRGMPGHLFAMMDTLQWNHHNYQVDKFSALPSCNRSSSKFAETNGECGMGCSQTYLSSITGSGFGADSWHLMLDTRRGLFKNAPIQAAPLKFGDKKIGGPDWSGQIGWTYTFQGCESNFLDCYFLPHSPCRTIMAHPNDVLKDEFRFHGWKNSSFDGADYSNAGKWWYDVFSSAIPEKGSVIPNQSVGSFFDLPAEQVFYSYMWRRQYFMRKYIHEKVESFNLNEECAAMHVRRGDSIHHAGQSRAYIRVESYVRAGRPFMDKMGIKTILLFTDSQSAIEEAENCARDYPDICEGIKFRWIEKKRWFGGEGGWENHFPSGSPKSELELLLLEQTLAQSCNLAIFGQSNYADKLHAEMCCGFPNGKRGSMPHRCICPPKVVVPQDGFRKCEDGNILICSNNTISTTEFTSKQNISKILKTASYVEYHSYEGFLPHDLVKDDPKVFSKRLNDYIDKTSKLMCQNFDHGPSKPKYCPKLNIT